MEYFKNRRKELGFTIEDVAKSIHVSRRRLSNFEKGTGELTTKELVMLCNHLNFIFLICPRESTMSEPVYKLKAI